MLGREVSREESVAWVGMPLREQMEKFSYEHADELVHSYRELNHREHDRMLTLYEGIEDLLHSLRKAGIKVGLVTSKSRFTTQMAFDLTGIEAYFDATICAGEASGNKPSPDPHIGLPGTTGSGALRRSLCGRQPFGHTGRACRRYGRGGGDLGSIPPREAGG